MLSLLCGSASPIDPGSHVGMCIHMRCERNKTVYDKGGMGEVGKENGVMEHEGDVLTMQCGHE